MEANRAVAVDMAEGPAAGLIILDVLGDRQAQPFCRLGRIDEAVDTY